MNDGILALSKWLTNGVIPSSDIPDDFIERFEKLIVSDKNSELMHADYKGSKYSSVRHIFADGLYVREFTGNAGNIFISKKHKTKHVFVVSKGVATIYSKEEGVKIIRAPYTGVTTPGTKRILYINEDIIWSTFHVTDETDLDKIEEAIIEKETLELCHGD